MSEAPQCKQIPGIFQPVIDLNLCEGKADCLRVCPVEVFSVGALPKDMRVNLSIKLLWFLIASNYVSNGPLVHGGYIASIVVQSS
jgi:ferredoxin